MWLYLGCHSGCWKRSFRAVLLDCGLTQRGGAPRPGRGEVRLRHLALNARDVVVTPLAPMVVVCASSVEHSSRAHIAAQAARHGVVQAHTLADRLPWRRSVRRAKESFSQRSELVPVSVGPHAKEANRTATATLIVRRRHICMHAPSHTFFRAVSFAGENQKPPEDAKAAQVHGLS